MVAWVDAVSIVLLVIAFVMTGAGGLLDILGMQRSVITKEHYWNDATFLVSFVIALQLIFKKKSMK